MPLGLPYNGENPNKGYVIFFDLHIRTIFPLEIQISSLRITLETHEDKHRLLLQELEALDDKWLQAQQQIKLYQAWIAKAFNNEVKEQIFKKGDLVLAIKRLRVTTHKTKGKFQLKWEGPFVVEIVYLNGAYRLINLNDDTFMKPINDKYLKKYYPWSGSKLHLWSKLHPDQSNGIGFRIQDVWESTKEDFTLSKDRTMIGRHRSERTLKTLWCIMSILKNWQRKIISFNLSLYFIAEIENRSSVSNDAWCKHWRQDKRRWLI